MSYKISAVLFDMGGVLIRLDSIEGVLGASRLSETEKMERWLASTAPRRHESGVCSADEFAEQVHQELELEGSAEEFAERFRRYPIGMYEGAAELVESVAHLPTAILSNTSALHWDSQPDGEIIRSLFPRRYLSYELGMFKPDANIFEHAVSDLGLAPAQVLFIDDSPRNVDGAVVAGLQSAVAKGPAEATQVLRSLGVL